MRNTKKKRAHQFIAFHKGARINCTSVCM